MRHLKTLALFGLFGLILSMGWLHLGVTHQTAHAAGEPRPLMPSIVPSVTLDVPATAFIGEDVNFTVTFDNPTSEEGYGPIIDLIIPTNGADGEQNTGSLPDTDPGYPDDQLDGLTFINATYLGVQVERTVLTFPGEGEVICIDHPYFVDATNTPIEVCGDAGDTFVSLRLPFGSFTPDQPPAEIQVSTSMSSYADLGFPLTIQARGGYQFGKDPLNNPATDNPVETISPWISRSVEPTLITLSKSYSGPEDETATGPNYPRSYTVTARIAPEQTLTDFFLEDVLPDNMQFIDLTSTSPIDAECNTLPSTTEPGGTLRCDFGTVSDTVSMTFEFFIPLLDADNNFVINPETGAFVTSCNHALGGGDWVPLDPRDIEDSGTFILDPPGCEHILSDQSIAIQKGVSVVGGGEVMPGKTLEYTLNIQVSDFFVFDDVVVTDTISDGQLFDDSFTPTFQVNGNTYTLSADDFGTANFDVTCNYTGMDLESESECTKLNEVDDNDGTTTLTFRLSEEIDDRGEDRRLVGGCVPLNGVGAGNDPDCAEYNNGATTAQIVYRTVIQREFNDLDPDSPGVVQGDQLDNTARVEGAVLSTDDASNKTTSSPWDGTSAGVSIGRGDVEKSFYAINGETTIPDPVEVRPGDEITYRVRYTMPVGDVKDLIFIDYFPLPVLRVNDPNADGSPGPAWDFETDPGPVIPNPGVVRFGPDDTFYAYTGIIPTLSTDVPNNSLEILYGDFFGVDEGPYVIDLLFTITVTDDPFADRLQLTNQIRIEEGSTAWGSFIDDGLIQFILTQPVVNIQKGVVWTNNTAGAFDPHPPAPVAFEAFSAVGDARWTGTINSSSLEATPINSNLSGVDAGDTVTFAIVLENTGSSGNGAFDVIVKDTLPDGFVEPAGGINLQVFNGEGSQITYSALSGGFFGDGIQLDNKTDSGSLGNFDPNSGENLAIITYDLVLADDVSPGQVITNTASLVRYAGAEGADNHLDTPRMDDAQVMIAEPVVEKALIATSQDHTTGTNVAIGEILTYEVTVTIPEGVSPNVTLTDTLDAGLAYVGCLEIAADDDLSTSLDGGFNAACPSPAQQDTAVNPAVNLNGREISWNLGTITNANRDNDIAETLTITYDVIVINSGNNVRGRQRNNEAVWTWETGTAQDSAEDVIIVEPTLQVVKTASPEDEDVVDPDAADTIAFSLVISHTAQSNSDAFEVSIFDDLSSLPYENILVVDADYDETACGTLDITDASSGAEIDFHINVIPLGCEVEITYTAVLDITVSPDQVITNTAEIEWQSLAEGEIDDPSPYTDLDCERSGDDTACGTTANTYSADDSDSVTIRSAQFTKELLTTGLVNANNLVNEAVIGETIDYRVVLTLPEGTTPDLTIRDILNPGLAFVRCLSITADEDLETDLPGGFGGACPEEPQDPDDLEPGETMNPTVEDARTVTFNLGTVINRSTDNSFTETIVIEYQAVMLNVAANQHGETRSNSARPFSGTSALTGPASAADVTIIEPVLNVTKAATIGGGFIGVPGDPVVYSITITNTGPTDAYDIVVMDPLPQVDPPDDDRSLITDAVIHSVNGPVGVTRDNFSLVGDNDSGFNLETEYTFDLLVGEEVVIVIHGDLLQVDPPAVSADQLIRNIVYMTWTSLPDYTDPISIYSPDSTERDGSDPDGVNNYTTLDEADIRIQNIGLDKDLIDPDGNPLEGQDVRIGETIRYRVRFTIPNDVYLEDLTFSDTLDDGLAYVDCVSISAHDDLISDQEDAFSCNNKEIKVTSDGENLDIAFGKVENTNLIELRVITLEYTAVVLNTTANERDEELGNVVSASFFVNDGTTTLTDSAPDVTINEPSLSVDKTANPTEADAGDTITFTITVTSEDGANFSNAYDLVLEDQIPDGLIYVDGSFTFDDQNGGIAPTSPPEYDEDTNTLSAGWAVFPPGASSVFTFEAVIDQGVAAEPGDSQPGCDTLYQHARRCQ